MSDRLDFKAACTGCHREALGRLKFDEHLKVIDSDGGVLFSDGWRCHNCLGEPWSSSDMVVSL